MRRLWVLSVLLWSHLSAAAEHAAPATGEAERLFRQARALMSQQRVLEACPLLERSQALEPALGTLLNLADCLERTARPAEAFRAFSEVVTWAHRVSDARREEVATRRVGVLRPRLVFLTVDVEPPGAELVLNSLARGVPVPSAGPSYVVEPGDYQLKASAPGYRVLERRVSLSRVEQPTTLVLALERLPAPPEAAPVVREPEPAPAVAAPAAITDAPVAAPAPRPLAIAGLVAGSLLIAGGAVGIVYSQDIYTRVERQQPGGTDAANPTVTRATYARAQVLYPLSATAAALGVAGLVASLVFFRPPPVALVPVHGGGAVAVLTLGPW
jgi:hypothetical protein